MCVLSFLSYTRYVASRKILACIKMDHNYSLRQSIDFSCLSENLSRESILQEYWSISSLGEQYAKGAIRVGVVLTLLFIIGVLLNLIVITVILIKCLYHNPSVLFLLNLSVSDLLLYVLVLPFAIIPLFAGEFILGNSDYIRCQVCKSHIIFTLLNLESVFNLLLSTIDRFIYFKMPLRYHSLITPKRVIFMIVSTWLVSFLLSIPPLLGFGEMEFELKNLGICTYDVNAPNYAYLLCLMALMLPFIVAIMVLNSWTARIAYKALKNQEDMNMAGKKSLTLKQHFVICRIFTAINITFILNTLPFLIVLLVRMAIGWRALPPVLIDISFVLFMFHPVLHPILQSFLVGRVRNGLKECCTNSTKCALLRT